MADFFNRKIPQSYYRRSNSDKRQTELLGVQEFSLTTLSIKESSLKLKLVAKMRAEVFSFMAVLLPPEVLEKTSLFETMFETMFKKLGLK